jgi:hypothetical protein
MISRNGKFSGKILWKIFWKIFRTGKFSMENFPPHITIHHTQVDSLLFAAIETLCLLKVCALIKLSTVKTSYSLGPKISFVSKGPENLLGRNKISTGPMDPEAPPDSSF